MLKLSSWAHVTALSYTTFVTAAILLGLAIAEIALTAVSLRAFRHIQIQIPGSSLAEWKFVPMDPSNIDDGTTTAKYVVGTAGLVASLAASVWVALVWFGMEGVKIRKLGVVSSIASIVNTICAVGFLIYTIVKESHNSLPAFYMDWDKEAFTREYYVCAAFPTVFENADMLFGFRACDYAQAAKFVMIAICCVSVILAAFVILQMEKMGGFKSRERWVHVEGRPRMLVPDDGNWPQNREHPPRSAPEVASTRVLQPTTVPYPTTAPQSTGVPQSGSEMIKKPAATRYG